MDAQTASTVERLLVGTACSSASVHSGFLELRLGKYSLIVHCAWRLTKEELIAGSGEEKSETIESVLKLQRVLSVHIAGAFGDLQLEFEDGAVLETFADSGGHEHWNIVSEDEAVVVAGPGRLWSSF